MITYTDEEKLCILSVLRLIMQADMIIHPAEEEYFNKVIENLEITTSLLDRFSFQNLQICKSIINNMPEARRLDANEMFVKMAECDGFADPRELEIIRKLCETGETS